MGIFTKNVGRTVPPECAGMEIKTQTSTCTGEKIIGFYNRNTRELMYSELVKSPCDIAEFYKKYGIKQEKKN